MVTQTFTKDDVMTVAVVLKTVDEMLRQMLDADGNLALAYNYIYTDLFCIYNRIYEGGAGLDATLVDTIYDSASGHLGDAQKHMKIAIGLAAGILTSPGVAPEVTQAQEAVSNAKDAISGLQGNVSQLAQSAETAAYIAALQKAGADSNINIDNLVKTLLWTAVLLCKNTTGDLESFTAALKGMYLQINPLVTAEFDGLFQLVGKTISLDGSGADDLQSVEEILGDVGDAVTVIALAVIGYNWKANGINPFASFSKIYQSVRAKFNDPVSDGAAQEDMGAAETAETVITDVTAADVIGGVLAAVGVALMIVGSIVEIVDLSKSLDKIDDAKSDFSDQYQTLKTNVQNVISGSEAFRVSSAAA